MSRALILSPEVQRAIDAAVAKARARPVPLEIVRALAMALPPGADLALKDRPPDFERGHPSLCVEIPRGFTACISFEEQPDGLVRHLSISVDTPGMSPNPAAVAVLAQAFGFRVPESFDLAEFNGRIWLEEFEPGHRAVNLVQAVQ